jgi:diketogulonate reductase-like aldo/keto reductase
MVGSVKLSSGHDFPILGLGTWKSQPGEVARAVKHALKTGYRHIDCAYVYGNEAEVGQGLKEAMEELNLSREEIFVTSKLWNCFHHPGAMSNLSS